MNNHLLPSAEGLQYAAQNGDTQGIEELLKRLQYGEGAQTELLADAVAIGTRLELAETLTVATENLEALRGNYVDDSLALNAPNLITDTVMFEKDIHAYLKELDTDVTSASEEEGKLDTLSAALQDEQRQQKALAYLAAGMDQSAAWLRDQAQETLDGTKESLWEAVTTGREFRVLVTEDNVEEYRKRWQNAVTNGFASARRELDRATTWLKQPEAPASDEEA